MNAGGDSRVLCRDDFPVLRALPTRWSDDDVYGHVVVTAGIGLERLGNASVVYRLALFGERGEEPAAVGRFVHVYVDAATRRPVAVPAEIRGAVRLAREK